MKPNDRNAHGHHQLEVIWDLIFIEGFSFSSLWSLICAMTCASHTLKQYWRTLQLWPGKIELVWANGRFAASEDFTSHVKEHTRISIETLLKIIVDHSVTHPCRSVLDVTKVGCWNAFAIPPLRFQWGSKTLLDREHHACSIEAITMPSASSPLNATSGNA